MEDYNNREAIVGKLDAYTAILHVSFLPSYIQSVLITMIYFY